LPIELISARSL